MVKGIIFDLDGVLVSTDLYHEQAWKALADRLGIRFDKEISQRLRGISRMESLDLILEQGTGLVVTEAEKADLADEKNRTYQALLQNLEPPHIDHEIRMTLEELRSRGYLLAVGSSSKNAGFILDRTNLRQAFDAVSDGSSIIRSKPDPEVFLNAARMLHLRPEECAVVEDADAGIKAAKAGNMCAVGIGTAANCPESELKINAVSDLLKFFGSV